ncbi:hypothetical protein IKF94_00180 [Candidatus Saccharibacteria bacterium]|nr:hypothetical protein [Candidatus Saccharibacteria bacterium]
MKNRDGFRLWKYKKLCLLVMFVVVCVITVLAFTICEKNKGEAFADSSVEDDIAVAKRIAENAKVVEAHSEITYLGYVSAAYEVVLPLNPLEDKGTFSYDWYVNGSAAECAGGALRPSENYCNFNNYDYGEISVDIYYEYDDNGVNKKVLLTTTANRPRYTPGAAEISYDFVGKDNSRNTKYIFLNNPEAIAEADMTDGMTGKYIYKTNLKKNTEIYFEHNRDGNPSVVSFFYGIKIWNGSGNNITIRFNRSGASVCTPESLGSGCGLYAKVWEEYYRGDGLVEGRVMNNGVWTWTQMTDRAINISAGGTKYLWLVYDGNKRGHANFILTDNDAASLEYVDNAYIPTSESWAFDGVLNMTITGGDASQVSLVTFAAKNGNLVNFAEGNNNQLGSLPQASYRKSQHTGEYDGLPEVKANIEYDIDNSTPAGTLKTYYSTTSDENALKLVGGWVTNITGTRSESNWRNSIAAYQRELVPLKLASGLKDYLNQLNYGLTEEYLRPFTKVATANYITRYYDIVTINNNGTKPRTVAYFINTASGAISSKEDTTLAAFVQKDGSSFTTFANGYDGDVFRPIENYSVDGSGVTKINNAKVSVTTPTFNVYPYRTNVKVWSAEIQPGGSITIPAISLMGGMSYGTLTRKICVDNVCEEPTYGWGVENGGSGISKLLGWNVDTEQVEPLTSNYSTCTVKTKLFSNDSFSEWTIRSNTDFAMGGPTADTYEFAGWSLNGNTQNLLPANYVFRCEAGETMTIEEILGDVDSGVESVSFDGNEYVVGIEPGTRVEDLDLGFRDSFQKHVSLSNRNGERNAPYTAVTGDIVTALNVDYPSLVLRPTVRYSLVVTSDTTGDGVLAVSDVAKAYRHATNKNLMTGGDLLAGDTNGDRSVDNNDVEDLYTSLRNLSGGAPVPVSIDTKLNDGSVSIECDRTELNINESTTCRLKGHSDYAITSLSANIVKLGSIASISNYEVNSSIWRGAADNGRFVLYTNQDMIGDFPIGSFVITMGTSVTSGVVGAREVSFDGASDYKNYAVKNKSLPISVSDSGETGGEPGGQTGGETGGQTGGEPGNEPGSETGGETGGEPGNEPGGEPGNEVGEGNNEDEDKDKDVAVPSTSGNSQASAPYTGANTNDGSDGASIVRILLPVFIAGFVIVGYLVNREKKHVKFNKR